MYTNSGLICPIKKDPVTTVERNSGYDRHRFENPPMVFANECDSSSLLRSSLSLFLLFSSSFFLPLCFSATCLGRSWGYWKMLIKHATSERFAQNRIVVNWHRDFRRVISRSVRILRREEFRIKPAGRILSSLKYLQDWRNEFLVIEDLILY